MIKKRKNLLFSGAGGALFPYLFDLMSNNYRVYAMDSNVLIKKMYPQYNVITVPPVLSKEYPEYVKEIIIKNKIEYYIPLIDEEIERSLILASTKYNTNVIAPKIDFVKLCLNKKNLMDILAKKEISFVKTEYASSNQNFKSPLFLKPVVGRGSRGIYIAKTKKEFEAYFIVNAAKKTDVLVQEYLEGEEYTVSVVVNNRNQLISIVPKRVILKKGITQCAVTEKNEQIQETCIKIVKLLEPCNPFNVQLKIHKNRVCIFEINPRFSTTSILSAEAGVNEFELAIEYFNKDYNEELLDFREEIYLFRRWENMFMENPL